MKPPPAPSLTEPGVDAALDVLAPDPLPAASSHRTPPPIPVVTSVGAASSCAGNGSHAGLAASANLSPPPAERLVKKSSPVGSPGTATIPSAFGASQMIFPPDQDVLVPAVRTRKPPRESKKSNLAVIVSGVVVLIAASVLLWVVLTKRNRTEPAAAEKSGEPSTQKPDDEHAAAANTNDENAPPGAVVKPATGSDTTPSKTGDRDGGDKGDKPERNPASSPLTPTSIETSPRGENGKELWASPTNGAPISLAYLPPGVQALLVVRPAELLQHSGGRKTASGVRTGRRCGAARTGIDRRHVAFKRRATDRRLGRPERSERRSILGADLCFPFPPSAGEGKTARRLGKPDAHAQRRGNAVSDRAGSDRLSAGKRVRQSFDRRSRRGRKGSGRTGGPTAVVAARNRKAASHHRRPAPGNFIMAAGQFGCPESRRSRHTLGETAGSRPLVFWRRLPRGCTQRAINSRQRVSGSTRSRTVGDAAGDRGWSGSPANCQTARRDRGLSRCDRSRFLRPADFAPVSANAARGRRIHPQRHRRRSGRAALLSYRLRRPTIC